MVSRDTSKESTCLLRRSRIGSTRILRNIEPRNAQTTGGTNNSDETFQDCIRLLGLSVRRNGLVPNG